MRLSPVSTAKEEKAYTATILSDIGHSPTLANTGSNYKVAVMLNTKCLLLSIYDYTMIIATHLLSSRLFLIESRNSLCLAFTELRAARVGGVTPG